MRRTQWILVSCLVLTVGALALTSLRGESSESQTAATKPDAHANDHGHGEEKAHAASVDAEKSHAWKAREFTTPDERMSYVGGYGLGQQMKASGVKLDRDAVAAGLNAALAGDEPAISEQQAQEAYMFIMQRANEEAATKGVGNAAEGEKFLTENAKRDGVKVTDSGLQYEVLTKAEGDNPSPDANDRVTVHYEGKLLDGEVFDSSYKRGEPITFPLNQVIAGWTEGVQLMSVGDKFKLYIPGDLAYGESPRGPGGPNSTLVFTVELLGVEPVPGE